jgi:hypothetical protein
MIKFKIPKNLAGDYQTDLLISLGAGHGWIDDGENLIQEFQSEKEAWADLEEAKQLVNVGGDVEGFPVFIKMKKTDLIKEVPITLAGSSIVDEKEQTKKLKWSEFFTSTGFEKDLDVYVPLSTNKNYVKLSEAMTLEKDFTLIDKETYLNNQPKILEEK